MLKITLIILAVLAIVATAGFAWARHNGYCTGGDFIGHVTARVSHKLDLNENQAARLQGFAETLRGLRGDWAERRTQMSDEVQGLLTTPMLDRDRVISLLDERHQAMSERKREMVDAFADFSDSLQPEQRTRLVELVAERMQHRWGPPRWSH